MLEYVVVISIDSTLLDIGSGNSPMVAINLGVKIIARVLLWYSNEWCIFLLTLLLGYMLLFKCRGRNRLLLLQFLLL